MDVFIFLNATTALFVIIDPIGTSLIFNSLIGSDEASFRIRTAFKASMISAALLILFGNYGELLLGQLGISIQAFRISGGILLFYTAFTMITSQLTFHKKDSSGDISVFPMSIPLLAGPGSLTVSILLFSSADGTAEQVSVFLAVLLVCLMTFICMGLSVHVKKIMGRMGDEMLRRFLGVLLAALAIQFILDGVVEIL